MAFVDVDTRRDQVAVVTLNRPDRLNALGATLVSEATAAMRALSRERSVSAVVLTGAGRGFCSGADLSGEHDPAPDSDGRGPVGRVHRFQEHIVELMLSVHECEKPVVAAVHGAAVGPTRAAELMLTGRHFSGEEADAFGMLNGLVPEGEHVEAAVALAAKIAENSEYDIWMTKRGLWANLDAPSLRHAIELENRTQVLGTFTGNMAEAMVAFQEKRPPTWQPL